MFNGRFLIDSQNVIPSTDNQSVMSSLAYTEFQIINILRCTQIFLNTIIEEIAADLFHLKPCAVTSRFFCYIPLIATI